MSGAVLRMVIRDNGLKRVFDEVRLRCREMTPALEETGRIMQESVAANFHEGGRPEAWKPSRRVEKEGGNTLVKSGRLLRSLRPVVSGGRVTLGTDRAGAAAHQRGVSRAVNVREHTRKTASGTVTVQQHTRMMDIPPKVVPHGTARGHGPYQPGHARPYHRGPEMSGPMLVISSELAGVPQEIQLIPWGSHRTGRGSFVLDEEGAASVMAAFDSQDNDMVIDYEHQTLRDVEAPAAGWITKLINKGNDGIWGEVQWNRRAVEYLNRREYRYLSPVFLKTGEEGRVVRLVNAALTNQPAIDGMVPVVAKQVMDTEGQMDFLEEMLTLLGLPEDAGPEDVRAAIDALKNGRDELAGRVESLETRLRTRDAGDLVSAAMKEGKITPAMKDWAVRLAMKDWAVRLAMKDEDGFREFLRNQPVVVEMKELAGGPDTGMSGDRADVLVEQHMKDNPQAGYRDALLAVSARHPGLFRKE